MCASVGVRRKRGKQAAGGMWWPRGPHEGDESCVADDDCVRTPLRQPATPLLCDFERV